MLLSYKTLILHMSFASLEGKVGRLIFKDGSAFTLISSENGKEYKCVRRGFSAVPGMKIAGRARIEINLKYGDQYIFMDDPKRIIDLEVNENFLISALQKPVKGFGIVNAKKLYDAICTQGNPLVILQKACVFPEIESWLKEVVEVLNIKGKNNEGNMNSSEIVRDIIKYWKKNEMKNFLISVGVESRKINKMSDELVRRVLTYPFTFYELTIDQCLAVSKIFNVSYTEDDIHVGHLARMVNDEYIKTYSTYFESKSYNELKQLYLDKHSLLRIDENNIIVGENETNELNFPVKESCASVMNEVNGAKLNFPVKESCASVMNEVNGAKLKSFKYSFENIYRAERELAHWFIEHKTTNRDFDDDEYWNSWKPRCSTLAVEQIEAVQGALRSNCSIITGPAGSGKTRIISEIVTLLRANKLSYIVGAFTGKAAFRARETLKSILNPGEDVLTFTLHSLIFKKQAYEKQKKEKEKYEQYTEKFSNIDDDDDYKVSGDNFKTVGSIPDYVVEKDPKYVIIDESSMVTGQLLNRFLKMFPDVKNLILIGDAAQLEPFSAWGRPFHYLTELKCIPVYELKKNFRTNATEGENGIMVNSERIREDRGENSGIVNFIWTNNFIRYTGKEGIKIIMQLLRQLTDQGERAKDIKILSPMNDKVTEINNLCQEFYKKTIFGGDSIMISNKKFCIGDLVIMVRNNYKIGLFNGSEGNVTDINHETEQVCVTFDEQQVWFAKGDTIKVIEKLKGKNTKMSNLDMMLKGEEIKDPLKESRTVYEIEDIQLAYALTVHRSQGSEWKYVVVYIPYLTRNCNRNMIYTAITRAKDICFCIDENSECMKATGKYPDTRREFFGSTLLELC